ncbi:MAG: dihydropteroate synthase [Pyrinomonadaceae bacterium]
MYWQTARRRIALDRPLVMGILNVTPDSFSDGGKFASIDAAVAHAGQMIKAGADIIDVGGESTRPGSSAVDPAVEISRVVPVIEQITSRHRIPVSIDTSKSSVAAAALEAGAEIVNDISALRWDPATAAVAARHGAALILMHSRGSFDTMHSQPPVDDTVSEVIDSLEHSVSQALESGVSSERLAVDVGIGFGKTVEQNLELIAKLDRIVRAFPDYPVVVGTSRKSFLAKLSGGPSADRLGGSIATALIAVQRGAKIVRVHNVAETVTALRTFRALEHV